VTRAQLKGLLTIPPPILSRFYQELSNGLVGFAQAYKVTATPFPFPFAQILALLLSVFCIVCPLIVVQMTDGRILPPILSFCAILSYWGLNQIAVELENPFGDDDNDLPLVDMHNFFVKAVEEAYVAPARDATWKVQQSGLINKRIDRAEDPALPILHAKLEEWNVTERFSKVLTLEHILEFTLEDLEDKFKSVDVAIALRAEIAKLVEDRDDDDEYSDDGRVGADPGYLAPPMGLPADPNMTLGSPNTTLMGGQPTLPGMVPSNMPGMGMGNMPGMGMGNMPGMGMGMGMGMDPRAGAPRQTTVQFG